MFALCPGLALRASKSPETDPPIPTFSPAADHGGRKRPRSECDNPPCPAMRFAQALASPSSAPSLVNPPNPWDDRKLLIAAAKSASYPALYPAAVAGGGAGAGGGADCFGWVVAGLGAAVVAGATVVVVAIVVVVVVVVRRWFGSPSCSTKGTVIGSSTSAGSKEVLVTGSGIWADATATSSNLGPPKTPDNAAATAVTTINP